MPICSDPQTSTIRRVCRVCCLVLHAHLHSASVVNKQVDEEAAEGVGHHDGHLEVRAGWRHAYQLYVVKNSLTNKISWRYTGEILLLEIAGEQAVITSV